MGHLPRNISTMCSILFGVVELLTAQFQEDGNIHFKCKKHLIIRKKYFAGKHSRLEANPRKPQKFSTSNDLHYTVLKKCEANKKQPYTYVRPKTLISAETKKLLIKDISNSWNDIQ